MCAVWHRRHYGGGRSRFRWKLYLSSQAWPLLSTSNRGETAIAKCGNCQHFCIHQRERFLIQEHPTYMWNSMHTVMAWYKKPLRGWTPGSAFSVACYGGIQTYVGTQSIGLTIRVQHFNRASYGLPHLRQHFIFSVPNDRWYFKVCFRLVCPPQSSFDVQRRLPKFYSIQNKDQSWHLMNDDSRVVDIIDIRNSAFHQRHSMNQYQAIN